MLAAGAYDNSERWGPRRWRKARVAPPTGSIYDGRRRVPATTAGGTGRVGTRGLLWWQEARGGGVCGGVPAMMAGGGGHAGSGGLRRSRGGSTEQSRQWEVERIG